MLHDVIYRVFEKSVCGDKFRSKFGFIEGTECSATSEDIYRQGWSRCACKKR